MNIRPDSGRPLSSKYGFTLEHRKIIDEWIHKWSELPIVYPTLAQAIAKTKMETSSITQGPFYAWYSSRQRDIAGYCVYSTPAGGKVVITEVARNKNYKPSWADAVYLGEVVTCLESHMNDGDSMREMRQLVKWPTYSVEHENEMYGSTVGSMIRPGRLTEVINLGPCPLKYYGTGVCSCGKCPKATAKKNNPNPFGY